MEFGIFAQLFVPKYERDVDPMAEHKRIMRNVEVAVAADRAGFKYVWCPEHHFLDEYSHMPGPEVYLSYVAAQTEQIHLGSAIFNINTESISEVKVLNSGYQAEYGLRSGLQVMAVTKSGTNQFHGSVYNVRRNSKWNANSKQNILNGVPKPVSKAQDIGFSVGGPVGKPGGNNKLFFFFAEEFNPATAGGNQQTFRLPTALERQGDFSQTRDNLGNLYPFIKDPQLSGACNATDQTACFRDGGVLGRIPQDRLYPLGLNILKMYPMPNNQSTTIGTNHQFIQPTWDTILYQPALRFDYQMTPGLRFSFKYAGNNNAKRASIGSLPGWNDTIVPIPQKGTEVVTVNYNVSSTTFIEGTYGRAGNQLAGCGGLSINDVRFSRTGSLYSSRVIGSAAPL